MLYVGEFLPIFHNACKKNLVVKLSLNILQNLTNESLNITSQTLKLCKQELSVWWIKRGNITFLQP